MKLSPRQIPLDPDGLIGWMRLFVSDLTFIVNGRLTPEDNLDLEGGIEELRLMSGGAERFKATTESRPDSSTFALSNWFGDANTSTWTIKVIVQGWGSAEFATVGAGAAVVLVSDPHARFSVTSGTANKVNVFWTGAQYSLQNLSGATRDVTVHAFR